MDNKLRFDFKTTQQVIKKIGFIDSFKGYWVNIEVGESKYLKELRRIATIQSIGSSTRIEGVTLTNTEIETLLHNLEITKLQSRDEQCIFRSVWFFPTFGGNGQLESISTRLRRSWKPARPYICRLIFLSRLICPST